jgi:hypothetical protein
VSAANSHGFRKTTLEANIQNAYMTTIFCEFWYKEFVQWMKVCPMDESLSNE